MKYFIRYVCSTNPGNNQQKEIDAELSKLNEFATDSEQIVTGKVTGVVMDANKNNPRCKEASVYQRNYSLKEGFYITVYSGNWYARVELIGIKGEI